MAEGEQIWVVKKGFLCLCAVWEMSVWRCQLGSRKWIPCKLQKIGIYGMQEWSQ